MKIKRKICRCGFMLGYWKGEQIALIPKYHPENNPDDFLIEEVEFEEDEIVPKLIDLKDYSNTEIKEICEYNDISFFWITGINFREKNDISILKTDLIGEALELFIVYNSMGLTTQGYRRFFKCLEKDSIINFKWTIEEFDVKREDVISKAFNRPVSFTSGEDAAHKSLHILRSFYRFIDNPNVFVSKKNVGNYSSKRSKDCLTNEEAKIFFSNLKKINPIFELIGQILRYYNYDLFKKFSIDFIVTIESLLRLKKSMIIHPNLLSIISHKLGKTSLCSLFLSEELFKRVQILASNTNQFVFSNKKGGKIHSGQLRRAFLAASKISGLRATSPSKLW